MGFTQDLISLATIAEEENAAIASGIFFFVAFAGLALFAITTQAGIISRATAKEAVRQPVFLLLLAIGIILLVLNTFVPFFTLGDDVKMLKDCGLATILICGALLAIWTSSTAIANEIEGKTAMTLLSKPINRRQFIVGKYFGILQAVMWLLVPLALCFLLLIYFKVKYDARESASSIPDHITRMRTVMLILPGLCLIFLEVCVLAAISVAISTRVPMIANMVTCFSVFVIGHLTPILVETGKLRIEFVDFMARLIATVLPALEFFNTRAAVAIGGVVPPDYLAWATAYCAAYCCASILLAFILFEDRDLA